MIKKNESLSADEKEKSSDEQVKTYGIQFTGGTSKQQYGERILENRTSIRVLVFTIINAILLYSIYLYASDEIFSNHSYKAYLNIESFKNRFGIAEYEVSKVEDFSDYVKDKLAPELVKQSFSYCNKFASGILNIPLVWIRQLVEGEEEHWGCENSDSNAFKFDSDYVIKGKDQDYVLERDCIPYEEDQDRYVNLLTVLSDVINEDVTDDILNMSGNAVDKLCTILDNYDTSFYIEKMADHINEFIYDHYEAHEDISNKFDTDLDHRVHRVLLVNFFVDYGETEIYSTFVLEEEAEGYWHSTEYFHYRDFPLEGPILSNVVVAMFNIGALCLIAHSLYSWLHFFKFIFYNNNFFLMLSIILLAIIHILLCVLFNLQLQYQDHVLESRRNHELCEGNYLNGNCTIFTSFNLIFWIYSFQTIIYYNLLGFLVYGWKNFYAFFRESGWNGVECIIFVISCVCLSYVDTFLTFENHLVDEYVSNASYLFSNSYDALNFVERRVLLYSWLDGDVAKSMALFCFLIYFRVVRFIELSPALQVPLTTIGSSFVDVSAFFIIFVVIGIAFGVLFMNSFGGFDYNYSGPLETTVTLLRAALNGDSSFSDFEKDPRTVYYGIGALILYTLVVTMIFLNIFIAIIMEHYEKNKDNDNSMESFPMMKIFKHSITQGMKKLNHLYYHHHQKHEKIDIEMLRKEQITVEQQPMIKNKTEMEIEIEDMHSHNEEEEVDNNNNKEESKLLMELRELQETYHLDVQILMNKLENKKKMN